VLAIDAKDGKVATRGWTQTTGRLAIDIAREVSGWKLGALLYTDVAKDGMLQGPNVEQTTVIANATAVPVIASGGVGNLDHIRALVGHPIWGVIIGRSLHDGRIALRKAIEIANQVTA
jgi:phosphoribosylformimino-5-aminoimidazole carboxamide ribotide isomerase